MPVEIKIPEIGESITEVVIAEWLKGEADHVEKDEDIVVIESDKATLEIAAPESGQLAKILKQSGEAASIGEVIGRLESTEDKKSEEPRSIPSGRDVSAEKMKEQSGAEKRDKADQGDGIESKKAEHREPVAGAAEMQEKELDDGHVLAHGRLDKEKETAPPESEKTESEAKRDGETRTTESKQPRPEQSKPDAEEPEREGAAEEDEQAIKSRDAESAPRIIGSREEGAEVRQPSVEHEMPGAEGADSSMRPGRKEKTVAMSPIRRRIAERLVQAQQSTAFLSTFNEIDMTGVYAMRRQYKEEFKGKHGVKLGLMSFFVRASVEALKLIPQVNAEIRGTDILYRNYYDIGVAIGGGKGLVVPVLRGAERMSFAAIERSIQDFGRKAEKNQLKPGDLEGGTFTISNGGIYGSLLSTPIINAPQSGILGMHAIQDRPVVRGGEIVVRPMMYVALTYDHRIVDGREAVTFLKRIKECVEAPSRMLLDI